MDSEEELQEENAEDIKSVENSVDEERDELESDEEKWIVPDGHFSNDEVSQIDEVEVKENANKMNGIMEIMEIRKNYPKYVRIVIADKAFDPKVKALAEFLRAKPFGGRSFPIVISEKKQEDRKRTGLNLFIEDRLDDVVREIHGSYLSKEQLIKSINEKYNIINKTALSHFFKDSVIKSDTQGRKYWLVRPEIVFGKLKFTQEDEKILKDAQKKLFDEEEEKRKEKNEKDLNEYKTIAITEEVNFV
jgi:hypothetical protein